MRSDAPQATAAAHDGPGSEERDAVLESVARALEGIDFGSVLIKVHQGRVVSIETSVKHRLPH